MKVLFFIKSGRRCCAAAVFVLVGLVTLTGTAGKSAARCQKNTGYNCGAVFPPGGNTCGQSGCCCRQEDGTGDKMNTCDGATGYAYRGCNSCLGYDACFETNNVNIGDSSCHAHKSCEFLSDSTIDNDSCHVEGSCGHVSDSTIRESSCQGDGACWKVTNSTIHEGSCQGYDSCQRVKNSIIGKGSCNGKETKEFGMFSCYHSKNITIGNNSCNGGPTKNNTATDVCRNCAHNVPDNACNQGITNDMTDGYCNFCVSTQGAVSYEPVGVSASTSKNRKSKSNKKQQK